MRSPEEQKKLWAWKKRKRYALAHGGEFNEPCPVALGQRGRPSLSVRPHSEPLVGSALIRHKLRGLVIRQTLLSKCAYYDDWEQDVQKNDQQIREMRELLAA
jgi:hypothetical protein